VKDLCFQPDWSQSNCTVYIKLEDIVSCEDVQPSCVYVGGNAVEIKTEADSDDMTEGPHDEKPGTGIFGFPDTVLLVKFIKHNQNYYLKT